MEAVSQSKNDHAKLSPVEEKKFWQDCLNRLQHDIPEKDFMIYISPLHAIISVDMIDLLAPNNEILNRVNANYLANITQAVRIHWPLNDPPHISLRVGSKPERQPEATTEKKSIPVFHSNLNKSFTFNTFVLGKSNQIARAAAAQVAENPTGNTYNPLFIHGGVGLGKTHLMHAIGNLIYYRNLQPKVLYIHSEGFVSGMVKALQCNKMDQFKNFYRELDCLLIDDIQFFAGKERSQEEFFHTLNALLDGQRQVVITCDKYPKEMTGLEERLKSRFGWGLTVSVEPPDLETRVAILQSKAEQSHVNVPQDVCFFIAQRIQSNVRELEGALKRVIANAHFTGEIITIEFAKEALKDLLAVQAKMVSIDNIIKTVAEYYKMKSADLLSKKRSRFIARSRQMAMTLAKELTNHSLPEIGDAFGGRDHTTVLHANRTIRLLIKKEVTLKEDFTNLLRILST